MSDLIIALPRHDGYDPHIWAKVRAMASRDTAELERRLAADEWLRPGEVGRLFGKSRWAVDYWLRHGVRVGGDRYYIGYRESPGGWRECDPADIRRVLAAYRTRRTARAVPPDEDTHGSASPPG